MTISKFAGFNIHTYKGYVQNNYLIEYPHGILILDGASRPDAKGLQTVVEEKLNKKMSDVKLIAVTHCHPDHAGAANILRKNYNIAIAAPHNIDDWYSGAGGALQHISDTLQARFMAVKLKAKHRLLYYSKKTNPDYKLFNESKLPIFSDWSSIYAPGHTLHNMLLYNKKNSIIYVADTVIYNKGKYLPPVPVLFPCSMKKTLLKIKELNPEYILLAHGYDGIMKFKGALIDEVIERIERGNPRYIQFFYLLSKFTREYWQNRHDSCDDY